MPGPPPKNSKTRQRRNIDPTAMVLPEPEKGTMTIPELPKRRRKWRPETVSWWNDMWASPMAAEFHDSDLHQLYILADLIDEYWRVPAYSPRQKKDKDGKPVKQVDVLKKKKELANEIRMQRADFGLTPMGRRRLQWQIERGESARDKGRERTEKKRKTVNHKVDPRTVMDGMN